MHMLRPEDKNLNAPDHGKVTPAQKDPSIGFESSDVNVRSVLVFLISLGAFILVFFVLVFGMGKVINTELVKHDGPANKWNAAVAAPHKMGKSMQSATVMEQQQLQMMTQRFPSPRLQMDDGNQDLADMHQKEDLLLDHYTWVNKEQGVVRIPIDRAMQLIVEKGLPVAPGAPLQAPVSAMSDQSMDVANTITAPLTNGFARTTYEQELATQDNTMPQNMPLNRGSVENPANKKQQTTQAKTETKAQAGGIQ
jgi:hypothetical protein